MDSIVIKLPAFLPGNNRNWDQVDGIATITEDGKINVRFQNPEDGKRLVEMARNNILFQISFDYRMPSKTIEKIGKMIDD